MSMQYKPENYYMITNRKDLGTEVDMSGGLRYFFTESCSSDNNWTEVKSKESWVAMIQNDIDKSNSNATLFIHGYGLTWDDSKDNGNSAKNTFWTYFNNLANPNNDLEKNPNPYPGVLIGFDWPSDDLGGIHQKQDFLAAKKKADDTSGISFNGLLDTLEMLKIGSGSINAICHSMGNYLIYTCTKDSMSSFKFNNVLCVAAELEDNSFDIDSQTLSSTPCHRILDNFATQVKIYWSKNDDVLPLAESGLLADGYKELGLRGPPNKTSLLHGVTSYDLSDVVNKQNAKQYGAPLIGIIRKPLVHVSYFYIPNVLKQISQNL